MLTDKRAEQNTTGTAWLAVVKDRFANDRKIQKIAGEIARFVGPDGRGELPSPVNIAKPVELTEDDTVVAVNLLIDADLMRLKQTIGVSCALFTITNNDRSTEYKYFDI
jgi:hypothetical protein